MSVEPRGRKLNNPRANVYINRFVFFLLFVHDRDVMYTKERVLKQLSVYGPQISSLTLESSVLIPSPGLCRLGPSHKSQRWVRVSSHAMSESQEGRVGLKHTRPFHNNKRLRPQCLDLASAFLNKRVRTGRAANLLFTLWKVKLPFCITLFCRIFIGLWWNLNKTDKQY